MFDLESNVAAWRQSLASRGSVPPAALDELEDHLRASFERLSADPGLQNALTPDECFALAARRIGDTKALSAEFERVDPSAAARRRWIWMLTGYVGIHLASQALLTLSVIVAATTWYADPLVSSAVFALTLLGGVAVMIWAAATGVVRRALDSVTHTASVGAWSAVRVMALGLVALLASTLLTPLGTIVSARSMSVSRLWSDPPTFAATVPFGLQLSARALAFGAPFVILTVLLLRERTRRSAA
jgi:hypothetical protein